MSELIDKKTLSVIQKPIELVPEPFVPFAEKLGTDTETIIQKIKDYINSGVIRRFAGIVKHNKAGFDFNAMVAFEVDNLLCDDAGGKLSSLSFVSHCYKRTPYSDWPYNLYAMMHARNEQEFGERVSEMKNLVPHKSILVLQSLKEYKKSHYL
ncbi:MAG: Lrp/AsnC family transcriptional regulator, partial [Fibrobacterota bacterium]